MSHPNAPSPRLAPSRLIPMRARDPHEPHRAASSLELFFDLVFVVAVGVASAQLHHALSADHIVNGVLMFALVFFAIWWAWMNFTWFATSFDVDDWLYRVLTFVQMGGVLVMAAGIAPVFEHHDFRVLVWSYVVMRIAMVAQWLRAAASEQTLRTTTLTYAAGIAIVQVLWVLSLALPAETMPVAVPLLVIAELAVPIVAERRRATPWHPHHITERYGLFTLIVLGESLLASANAIIEALQDSQARADAGGEAAGHGSADAVVAAASHGDTLLTLIGLAALTLIASATLWWIYFWPPHHGLIGTLAQSIRYGYVHYFVFAAAAAFSAGIEVHIDALSGEAKLPALAVGYSVSIPVAVFILGIWWIALRRFGDRIVNTVVPLSAVVILLDPLLPFDVAVTAIVLVIVVAVLVWRPPLPRKSS